MWCLVCSPDPLHLERHTDRYRLPGHTLIGRDLIPVEGSRDTRDHHAVLEFLHRVDIASAIVRVGAGWIIRPDFCERLVLRSRAPGKWHAGLRIEQWCFTVEEHFSKRPRCEVEVSVAFLVWHD